MTRLGESSIGPTGPGLPGPYRRQNTEGCRPCNAAESFREETSRRRRAPRHALSPAQRQSNVLS